MAAAMRPLYGWLRARVDRLFLGERADVLRMVADFRPVEPSDFHGIAEEILELVRRAFDPVWVTLGLDHTRLASISDGTVGDPALAVSHRLNDGREEASIKLLAAHAALFLEHAGLCAEKVDLMVEEGVARSLAEERRTLLMQILHDMRSDLFNITVTASRVERQSASDDALASIRRSLGRIEAFLDDKLAERRRSADVRAAIEGACRTMAPKLAEKAQGLECDLPADPIEVGFSPVELEQVIHNLLDNASKFSPSGTRIHLSARLENGQVVVRVEDEGPGIPEELLDALATGKRADPSIPGSGWGLQNVEALLDQCGGKPSWGNREAGTRVEVRMPMVAVTAPLPRQL